MAELYNYFFEPARMESQFLASSLASAFYQKADAYAEVQDGHLVTITDNASDPVYESAFKRAGMEANAPKDINSFIAVDAAAGAGNIWVIDLAGLPTKTGQGGTIRDGYNTIGLSAEAGEPVRARKLAMNDTFKEGIGNFTAAPTVGQFAVVGKGGLWTPAATKPATGACVKIVSTYNPSQGVRQDVDGYFMQVVQVA